MPTAVNVRDAITTARTTVVRAGVDGQVIDDLVQRVAARCAQLVIEFQPSLTRPDGTIIEALDDLRADVTQQAARGIQAEFLL